MNGVSILIMGMEMPKNCLTCRCSDSEYGECVLDPEKRCPEDYKQRAEWCLLAHVPPHGDLVERQAVLNTFQVHMNRTLHFVTIRDTIPTIIPAEEGK